MIIVLVLMAVFADYVTPYGRFEISLDVLKAPSFAHPFGTDDIGRDQFTRLVYGARISIYVGLLAVGAGVVTGAVIGLVSGFFGGILDLVVQRFIDAMLAFPGLVRAMALVAVLGPSTTNALLGDHDRDPAVHLARHSQRGAIGETRIRTSRPRPRWARAPHG